jgi:hypothetical protein
MPTTVVWSIPLVAVSLLCCAVLNIPLVHLTRIAALIRAAAWVESATKVTGSYRLLHNDTVVKASFGSRSIPTATDSIGKAKYCSPLYGTAQIM